MKFPDLPRPGELMRESYIELLNWCRANNVTGIVGGRIVQSPNGKIIFPPAGETSQISQSGGVTPWEPSFFMDGADYKCRFNLGTCNNVVASNWNDAFTLPSDDSSKFVVLTVTTASGKVTGISLSVDASAPAEDVIAEDTPPITHKIVLGAIGKTSAQMIIDFNIVILAEEVFRSSAAAPAAGAEPFNRWWRWSVQPA